MVLVEWTRATGKSTAVIQKAMSDIADAVESMSVVLNDLARKRRILSEEARTKARTIDERRRSK